MYQQINPKAYLFLDTGVFIYQTKSQHRNIKPKQECIECSLQTTDNVHYVGLLRVMLYFGSHARMTTSTVYTMVSLCQTKHMLSIVIFQVVELINFNFAFYECYLLFDRPLITFLLLFRCILHWRQAKPCATETSSDTVIVSFTYIHFRYIR